MSVPATRHFASTLLLAVPRRRVSLRCTSQAVTLNTTGRLWPDSPAEATGDYMPGRLLWWLAGKPGRESRQRAAEDAFVKKHGVIAASLAGIKVSREDQAAYNRSRIEADRRLQAAGGDPDRLLAFWESSREVKRLISAGQEEAADRISSSPEYADGERFSRAFLDEEDAT